MTITEYTEKEVPKQELQENSNGTNADTPSHTAVGGIVSTNNNMNSRVNKQLDQLPENLRLNGKTPSGKPRLFVCQVCTRAFARQEHLTRHERSHTKEKPYCCGICNRKFSRRDLLLRHAHKIHGGNYGDTILKREHQRRQQQSSSRISKKRKSSTSQEASADNLSPKLGKTSRFKVKRRVSYSAQSGSYVAPLQNQEAHKVDRVKFSTPELLPIDFKDFNPYDGYSNSMLGTDNTRLNERGVDGSANPNDDDDDDNDDDNDNDNDKNNDNANRQDSMIIDDDPNTVFSEIPNLALNTPNEFNLLDQVNWINDYNEHTVPFTGSIAGTGTEMATTDSAATDNSPRSISNNTIPNHSSTTKNVRNSSWSINSNDGGLQIKSLFVNSKSPSSTSPDNSSATLTPLNKKFERPSSGARSNQKSVDDARTNPNGGPNPNGNATSEWFQISSNGDGDNGINIQNDNRQLYIRAENEMNDLTDLTKEVQSIFSRFIQDEETNLNDETSQPSFHDDVAHIGGTMDASTEGSTLRQPINHSGLKVHGSGNNYSFYGIDYLSLSNISRASPPNIFEMKDLSPSKLFTSELREMCLKSLKYYNVYCYNSGNNDPILTSKELVLPSSNELNCFVSYFQEYFNSHHTFIHPDFFNLDIQSLRRYVREDHSGNSIADSSTKESDSFLQYSNIACLPLFVATLGSLYKPGCNSKTMELYEISRRVLHVYLEKRKEQNQTKHDSGNNSKPGQNVWLIQSLTLSIVFALFADYSERVDTKMIKRQVSAVCSIVRNNFLNVISHNFAEQKTPNALNRKDWAVPLEFSNFDSSTDYVMFESKIRTSLMVYEFCQFLKIFYHVDSKLFLTESDLEAICIPDDEYTWHKASLLMPISQVVKKYTSSFQNFYHSFSFNNSGMHPIPESLAAALLYYEFNASTFSSFHVFLTRIDTRKLESNMLASQRVLEFSNDQSHQINYSIILNSDAVKLRNCLMTMVFFTKIDINFCSKIWNGQLSDVYEYFLSSKHLNILTKGSYSLLTDFLVASNFSIKNVANLLKLNNYGTVVELDKKNLSLFNLQGYYYDFLVIIKFINDFEFTPNFKLLCIYTELKKLANNLLIPHFFSLYPSEFTKFEDIALTSEFLQQQSKSELKTAFSTIDTDRLEKLINNVLVYSFNDASFLNMTDQCSNEFPFNNDHSSYTPNLFTNVAGNSACEDQNGSSNQAQNPNVSWFDEQGVDHRSNNNEPLPTKSTMDLLLYRNNPNSTSRQCFADRYHLSDKYVSIAICFLKDVKEVYAHSHILDKMINDFKELEKCLDHERGSRSLPKLPSNRDNNFVLQGSGVVGNSSPLKDNSALNFNFTDNNSSKDLLNKFLQPTV